MSNSVLEQGELNFTIESRILRELGERLVKRPEIAVVELIKNAYDADATECKVICDFDRSISVEDDGVGMNFKAFKNGWMRIGTSSKESIEFSEKYSRRITGEKGIGRFAVRFLGRKLRLESVADDLDKKRRTRLVAEFDWPEFDNNEDLGKVRVPYLLELSDESTPTGTKLQISSLRVDQTNFDMYRVRTSSISVVSPLSSLLQQMGKRNGYDQREAEIEQDPGFILKTQMEDDPINGDIASAVLDEFTIRASLKLSENSIDLRVYQYGEMKPYIAIFDTYPNQLQQLYADIRFFPRRKGAFAYLPVDGRRAYSWISTNSGVAVYDRNFRVSPYGMDSNDWLQIDADAARNRREPRSSLANKHFPMSDEERNATSENWMLRLPQSAQLVGLVSVEGRRVSEFDPNEDEGLIAAADREGFIENQAFLDLYDLIRGVVEAIAYVDRRIQRQQEQEFRENLLISIRKEAEAAIEEVQQNPSISDFDKKRIIAAIAQTHKYAEEQEETIREQQSQLEVMSLLGVVAGFMTHEFGVALQELENSHTKLTELRKRDPSFDQPAKDFAVHIYNLKEFVKYASGYIQGTKTLPSKPYPARPRIQQVARIFGRYAKERNIDIVINVDSDVMAPFVPVSLYNGISLNLYTNALKSVTAKMGSERGEIAFCVWNENRWHYLQVLDTGIGIPSALRKRVFDPLFSTTQSQYDPLGSGMGLGLALVKRSVESFGGNAEVVKPPAEFSTCVQIRLPLKEEKMNGK